MEQRSKNAIDRIYFNRLPLPCIFVSDTEHRNREVVDGLQRVSTLVDFVSGKPADTEFVDQYHRFDRLIGELTYPERHKNETETAERSGFWSLSFKELPPAMQRQFKQARLNVPFDAPAPRITSSTSCSNGLTIAARTSTRRNCATPS